MSFSDTIFLFFLALILFGPKKLPEMARQAGKLLAELRRASNEFRSQIETEISHLEVQKTHPPNPPPQATVSSSTGNSATSELVQRDVPHTPVVPPDGTVPMVVNSADLNPAASSNPTPTPEPAASQDPHV
jgi:sec-independent protein translocase protein TatB